MPVCFEIDAAWLAERYRALVDTSPDESRPAGPDPDVSFPEPATAELATAYQTLADPIARASHLLDLLTPSRTLAEDGCAVLSGFLMAQIEMRESLTEAANSPDPLTAVATILTELAEQGASLAKQLEHLLARPTPESLGAARAVLRQIEFIGSCRRDAECRRALLSINQPDGADDPTRSCPR
ncbi:MAG: molecular chaperone Hsc20 [Sphingobacteriia bacterium]|nr:molecular chaperone Hsc20 [Sphingobacteriia bacterium]